jgi:hypothetical protein
MRRDHEPVDGLFIVAQCCGAEESFGRPGEDKMYVVLYIYCYMGIFVHALQELGIRDISITINFLIFFSKDYTTHVIRRWACEYVIALLLFKEDQ